MAIVFARSGPGCGPSVMSAWRCSRRSANDARDRLDPDLEPFVAGGERFDQRSDVLGDDVGGNDLQTSRLTGGIVDRPARLFGQTEDLAGQCRQPPAACGERDPPPLADEQLVAEFPS